MRSRDSKRRESKKGTDLKRTFAFFYASLFLCLLISGLSTGCVRAVGTAGYWHTNAEGESQAKRIGVDTANFAQKDRDQGNVTV